MRTPSRRMPPPLKHPLTIVGAVVLLVIAGCLSAAIWAWPLMMTVILAGMVIWSVILNAIDRKQIQRLVAQRQNDSICSFARSFDYRKVDTWIIRAMYEELQICGFPIRATDRFDDDLGIVDEDFDDIAYDVAARVGRSMEDQELVQNPLYGKVTTVRDLVLFLSHQPKLSIQGVQ